MYLLVDHSIFRVGKGAVGRDSYLGIGILLLAAALMVSVFAQARLGGSGGFGMMGGLYQNVRPVTSTDDAAARAREALAFYDAADFAVAEVMEFSNHFYVSIKEKSTRLGAMELIVERNSLVHPEPGPTMMWNTKYGHMAGAGGFGMMGGGMMGYSQPAMPSTQPITKDRARQIASQYLSQASPGATPDDGTAFYGYVTFDFERNGKTAGMLSVNAYTGAVWYHSWHGTFVQEKHFEEAQP